MKIPRAGRRDSYDAPRRLHRTFSMTTRFRRQSAFTILEIVLVVGILLMMVLAILPAFKKREAERRYPLLPPSAPTATPIPIPKELIPSRYLEPSPEIPGLLPAEPKPEPKLEN